jgi:hypothetical protein
MKRRKRYYDTDDDGSEIVPPGGRVRVNLTDAQRRCRSINDAVAEHNRFAGNRPHDASAALYSVTMDAAGLADAAAERQRAFDEEIFTGK